MTAPRTLSLHAPSATSVEVVVVGPDGPVSSALHRLDGRWVGELSGQPGAHYWYVVDGFGPLLDPSCWDVEVTDAGLRSVIREGWPTQASLGRHHDDPVVYELHVRGFAGTFGGVAARLDYLAQLGVQVIELMPVHPFDPSDNYWGYMPVVWGAVHRRYADHDAPDELAALIGAAHDRDIEVWLDVVFNHTGEGDRSMPTLCLRGIDDSGAYLRNPDGSDNDDSGCGNVVNPADPEIRRLVLEALDRFADLGVDGFRFDLASLLTRDGGELVAMITGWSQRRGVCLIAEAWDLAAYQVGDGFPDRTWRQWNDRFRDDVRGLLAAEEGRVGALMRRVQGSPDVFGDSTWRSINFLTAHDGLTMHDLTLFTDGHHHSWGTGPELRLQQLKNYFAVLLLSHGSVMFVMGDEFARTQDGDPNPYNVDGPRSWVDWSRLDEWADLHASVRLLIDLRGRHPRQRFEFHGVGREPDVGFTSHSLAWTSGDLYVMLNAWSEPLAFTVQQPGTWDVVFASAAADAADGSIVVAAHSVVVLEVRR